MSRCFCCDPRAMKAARLRSEERRAARELAMESHRRVLEAEEEPFCRICGALQAWCYMPDPAEYYCDVCVPRGCSCMDDEGLDEHGREYPCIEFMEIET